MREPTREGEPLDLLFNRKGLMGDVLVGAHLRHSDHKTDRVFDPLGNTKVSQQSCDFGFT